jgi:ribosome-binding protein aMBF1 (putative translation factor)
MAASDDGATMTITGEQVRAARELLGWPRKTLAGKCKPGETTIRNFENGARRPSPFNVLAIRRALEAAGIEFDQDGHGVRLREGKP